MFERLRKMKIFGQENKAEDKPVFQAIKEKVLTIGAGFLEVFDRGKLVNYKSVSSKLLDSYEGWVYANVSALAEEVSKMEFELFRIVIVKNEIVYEPILSHPVLDLLDRFNKFTTSSDAMFLTEAHLELAGDTFYLLDNPTNPENIFILQPDKVTLEIGGAEDNYRVTAYLYEDNVDGKLTKVKYAPEQIIHIKVPNPNNPYRGQSAVLAAAQTVDIDILSAEQNKMFYKNAATPNFILSTEQKITKDDMERLTADLRRNFGGYKNAHKTMVLGGGLEPKTLSVSNRDMQFIEQQRWTRDKLMSLFKNTKVSLGITDDVNRANAEASLQAWKENVIKPKMKRIVDNLNEFLLPTFGQGMILGFKDPVPENRQEKIDLSVKLKNADIISQNEAREELGYKAVEGGDEFNRQRTERMADKSEVPKEIPKSISNVSYTKHLRRAGIYEQQKILTEATNAARSIAERIIKLRKKPKKEIEEERESKYFTNEEVWGYWGKQIHMVEVIENRFKSKIVAFLDKLEEVVVANLKKSKSKDLFDEEQQVESAINLFEPLTQEIAMLSGEQANDLLNVDKVFVPSVALKDRIKRAVEEFSTSMLNTDQEKLSKILADGLDQGQSIPQIERSIRASFADFKKVQSERIARTEILRASNEGSLDAFEQSGVVEKKQWLTAEDDRVDPNCAALNGKIISLGSNFFKADFLSGRTPPLHPNCRCVLIPVLKDLKSFEMDMLKREVEELRQGKEKAEKYSQELEKVVGLGNE